MKHRIFIVTVLAAAMVVSLMGAGSAQPTARQISVTGQGRVEAAPDMATITVGVTNEDKDASRAMGMTSQAVTGILQQLEKAGIAARDMQTQRLSLNPVWSNRNGSSVGRARITGFVASNMVTVRVRDLGSLGAVIAAVVADGANDFNGLRFSVQEPRPLIDEARRAAVADAMARAALLADAAGLRLGPVVSMSEQGGARPVRREMAMSDARGGAVPVAAGELTFAASVSMVFEIAQ